MYWSLQNTDEEHDGNGPLLPNRHVQLPDDNLRQDDQYQVGTSVYGTGDDEYGYAIQTMSFRDRWIPSLRPRTTEKDFEECRDCIEQDIYPKQSVENPECRVADSRWHQDPDKLDDDGCLQLNHTESVDNTRDNRVLYTWLMHATPTYSIQRLLTYANGMVSLTRMFHWCSPIPLLLSIMNAQVCQPTA
jgi:hypothetical protein